MPKKRGTTTISTISTRRLCKRELDRLKALKTQSTAGTQQPAQTPPESAQNSPKTA